MRPISKGAAPQPNYARYQDALDDLANRIGLFCSYCEQPIPHAPEVEHVQPKSLEPALERSWDNFLLGCKSCNTIKGNNPVDLAAIAFPDMDNTFRGLLFKEGGWVEVSENLTPDAAALMSGVVNMVKLDRHPDAPLAANRPTPRDKRAQFRNEVWLLATRMLDRYLVEPSTADLITDEIAPARGFFSVWMTVFSAHPEMLRRFSFAFPGTDQGCFDAEYRAILRPAGRI